MNIIRRQLGHTDLGTTSTYLHGIDPSEIVNAVHSRRAPMTGGCFLISDRESSHHIGWPLQRRCGCLAGAADTAAFRLVLADEQGRCSWSDGSVGGTEDLGRAAVSAPLVAESGAGIEHADSAKCLGDPDEHAGPSTYLDDRAPSRYIDEMAEDLRTTWEQLDRQLTEAISSDPIGVLPIITALQKRADAHLREAVRQAAITFSWSEIAMALGVSKQAAHQRFKAYATDVAKEIKSQHRAILSARRAHDRDRAAESRARRDELVAQLHAAAREMKSM